MSEVAAQHPLLARQVLVGYFTWAFCAAPPLLARVRASGGLQTAPAAGVEGPCAMAGLPDVGSLETDACARA